MIREVSKKIESRVKRIVGSLIAVLVLLAGVFDALENYSLINLYLGNLEQKYSTMAYYFAISKFSILLLAIGYLAFIVIDIWKSSKKRKFR